MTRRSTFSSVHRIYANLLILMFVMCFTLQVHSELKFFNVKKYGAVGNGKIDCTKAFLSCWNDACKWKGKAQLVVPHGTYLIRPSLFKGPCLSPIDFHNAGVIKAHDDDYGFNWIIFKYINRLSIYGGGAFDGQGTKSWMRISEENQLPRPISLTLDHVTNSKIESVKFINSKGSHLKLYSCKNIRISQITIVAPGDSPNTDGINISHSSKIQVSDSRISTGDDCISVLPGTEDVNITGIFCGPGHGISIGSMGGEPNEPDVKRVMVKHCNFTNTLNGVRIKTWATKNPGHAAEISFESIFVNNVSNPIIIDQNYCPSKQCPEGNSHVQISKVKFKDIKGVSRSRVAVNFGCSKYKPCQVETRNIDLQYDGSEGPIQSLCSNVLGTASGYEKPPSCISQHLL